MRIRCVVQQAGLFCTLILAVILITGYRPAAGAEAPAAISPPAATQPMTTTLSIPNAKPTAVEWYETGNKFYVADSTAGTLLAYDGATRQQLASIAAGKNIFPRTLLIDETYGRAYAASASSFNSVFGQGSGLVYVVSTITDTLLTTLDVTPYMKTRSFAMAHDATRHRVYLSGPEGLIMIDVATNAITVIPLSNDIQSIFFLIDEMEVDATTNTLYMLQDSYSYERLWILNLNTQAWSFIDFPALNARDPQHLAVSEAANKVFVKVVQMPVNNLPGLYILNRATSAATFVGSGDFGPMVVNDSGGRLYTGVEVDTEMAIVETDDNSITHLALEGATTGIGVRNSTDHAFLVNQRFIAIVDGASRTLRKLPVAGDASGGILVQDLAVHQASGMICAIPDAVRPEVILLQDLPAGPVQHVAYLALIVRGE